MRLPFFIVSAAGTKSWFVPHALEFLGNWCPRVIVEPFAGSGIVGLTLLHELSRRGCDTRLVLAERNPKYLAYWHTALYDPNFSYRVAQWTEKAFRLPLQERRAFVMASLEDMKHNDPGFWTLLRSRTSHNRNPTAGFTGENQRGGILRSWPRNLDQSLDLLYRLRRQITVMEDGFAALAAFDHEDAYAFIDSPYTMTAKCPGHALYEYATIARRSAYGRGLGC